MELLDALVTAIVIAWVLYMINEKLIRYATCIGGILLTLIGFLKSNLLLGAVGCLAAIVVMISLILEAEENPYYD